jgi:hypothetical protein
MKKTNSIVGVVERVTFEGTNVRYEIRLENQDLVVVIKPSVVGEWLSIDEKVTISFPPDKARQFIYPAAGLKEEMAVE